MQDNTIEILHKIAEIYLIKLFKDKYLFLYII
jgi:hypothetical protein